MWRPPADVSSDWILNRVQCDDEAVRLTGFRITESNSAQALHDGDQMVVIDDLQRRPKDELANFW